MRQTQCHKPSRLLTWYTIFFGMFIQNPLVMVTGQVFPRLEAIEKCAATAGGAGSIPFNEGYKAMDILKGQYEP